MSGENRLAAEHITFGYRAERRILDDVSLTLAPGEVLGLLGPNGTGKTTLIKCIAQLLQPSAGTVRVDGTDLADLRSADIAKMIAYVPQYTNAAFGMTALQAVLMGRLPYAGHRYRAKDERIAFDVMERMGLSDFAFRNIVEMSGGERQRVGLARALAKNTGLLLVDEATSALDATNEQAIVEALGRLRGHRTMVIVTHRPALVSIADTVVVLKDGAIAENGTVNELIDKGGLFTHLWRRWQDVEQWTV